MSVLRTDDHDHGVFALGALAGAAVPDDPKVCISRSGWIDRTSGIRISFMIVAASASTAIIGRNSKVLEVFRISGPSRARMRTAMLLHRPRRVVPGLVGKPELHDDPLTFRLLHPRLTGPVRRATPQQGQSGCVHQLLCPKCCRDGGACPYQHFIILRWDATLRPCPAVRRVGPFPVKADRARYPGPAAYSRRFAPRVSPGRARR